MLTHVDWTAIVANVAFVYFQFGASSLTNEDREFYRNEVRKRVPWAPPEWVFGPVWTLLFAGITTNAVLFSQRHPSPTYTAAFYCYLINIAVFNKLWSVLFFKARRFWLAALDALLIVLSAVAVLVLQAVDGERRWYVFGSWSPYIPWTAFATALSFAVAASFTAMPSTTSTKRRREQRV
jgi:benzodiazapine receptor